MGHQDRYELMTITTLPPRFFALPPVFGPLLRLLLPGHLHPPTNGMISSHQCISIIAYEKLATADLEATLGVDGNQIST
jgi:hypothetical protein